MKKLLLILCFALVVTGSAAAQEHPKNILGIRAGLNLSYMHITWSDTELGTSLRPAFHLGVSDQVRLFRTPFYLETGLYVTLKGTTLKTRENGWSIPENTWIHTVNLQVPLMLAYHISLSKNATLQPAAGVYYELGLYGRYHFDEIRSGCVVQMETEENLYGRDSDLHRSDFGVRANLGLTLYRFCYVGIGYEVGLLNTAKKTAHNTFHNRCVTMTLGYNF